MSSLREIRGHFCIGHPWTNHDTISFFFAAPHNMWDLSSQTSGNCQELIPVKTGDHSLIEQDTEIKVSMSKAGQTRVECQ